MFGNALSAAEFDGAVRLIAGPGAGKTKALVDLYQSLISTGRATRGEILVLTFSKAAAEELARRIDDRLVDSYPEAWISTFHSFCARLLREQEPRSEKLLLNGFQEWLSMQAALTGMPAAELGGLSAVAPTDTFAQDALGFVAMLKQNRVGHREFRLAALTSGSERVQALSAAYSAYQERCEAAGLEDFRDLIANAIHLLERRPELCERLRHKFRFVLVDEFQDVDPAQFALLTLLVPPASRPRLLVAGDPDQSIYRFRGAVPDLLTTRFAAVYGGHLLELNLSHRCPPEALSAAGRLLRATQPGAPQREFQSAVPATDCVSVAREANAIDEAFFVAREIRQLLLADSTLRPGDFAILLRSTLQNAAPFGEALRALHLPSEVRGAGGFVSNEVVRFLLTMLRALNAPEEPESLAAVVASPLSGVPAATASRLRQECLEQGKPLPRLVRRLMYWLHELDAPRYPLPWEAGGPRLAEAPLGPAPGIPAGSAARPTTHSTLRDLPPDGSPVAAETAADPGLDGPAPAVEIRPPAPAGYLTEAELDALHRAVTTYYRGSRKARHLPLRALAYWLLMEAGVMQRLLLAAGARPAEEPAASLAALNVALTALADLEGAWQRLHGRPPLLSDVAARLEGLLARAVDDVEAAAPSGSGVQILTVHQAKGLEFAVVFLSGFGEGIFPLAARPNPVLEEEDQAWLAAELKGFIPSWPASAEEHVAEEGRLAYVGLTRARRRLYVTYADEYSQPVAPSPFLEPALNEVRHCELSRSGLGVDPEAVLSLTEAETLLTGVALTAQQADRLRALGADTAFLGDAAAGQSFQPELVRPQHVAPASFSATAINDYIKCPRLYWFNQHPGLAKPLRGVELSRGGFIHDVLEEFHRREDEWRDGTLQAKGNLLRAIYEERLGSYLDQQEGVLDRKREEQLVHRILRNYIEFVVAGSQPLPRRRTLAVEKRFVLQLEGAEIHGKIDRVNDLGDGTCEVIDYKSGKAYGAQSKYRECFGDDPVDVQLLLYYLACREGVDEENRPLAFNPRYLSLWYPKEYRSKYKEISQVMFAIGERLAGPKAWQHRLLTDEDLSQGRATVVSAIQQIRSGDFQPRPRADVYGTCLNAFSGCPHATICHYGRGPAE
ncbi:MAG: ATP-dependent helicase [Candidatus Dormibacteraeota bacterium]|nr:ATP-dependent helicase [Candidatus Dormibacteraeota bacterium]